MRPSASSSSNPHLGECGRERERQSLHSDRGRQPVLGQVRAEAAQRSRRARRWADREHRDDRSQGRPATMTESQRSSPEEDGEAEALRHDYVLAFCRRIEERAFADLMSWVPMLIQGAVYQVETRSFRRLCDDFSHPELYENLIITPTGAVAIDIRQFQQAQPNRPRDRVSRLDRRRRRRGPLARRANGIDENERRAMGYRDGETLTPFAKVKQAAGS